MSLQQQRRNLTEPQKHALLGKIKDNKAILMGQLGDKLDDGREATKILIRDTWQEIYDYCAANAFPFCNPHRNGEHIRYKTFYP